LQDITVRVRQLASENGVDFIDLLPALKSEAPWRLWVSPTDPHPNARANALIAAALFAKLAAME
jgi:hypothetical protein